MKELSLADLIDWLFTQNEHLYRLGKPPLPDPELKDVLLAKHPDSTLVARLFLDYSNPNRQTLGQIRNHYNLCKLRAKPPGCISFGYDEDGHRIKRFRKDKPGSVLTRDEQLALIEKYRARRPHSHHQWFDEETLTYVRPLKSGAAKRVARLQAVLDSL